MIRPNDPQIIHWIDAFASAMIDSFIFMGLTVNTFNYLAIQLLFHFLDQIRLFEFIPKHPDVVLE
jgi:hypothetical protein